MVETLSELLESAANVAEDNGGKLSIASVAALIAMLLTIWDCDFKWVKIFLSIAAISTIGMIIVVTIKVMMSV